MPAQKGKDILFSPDGYEIWIPRKFEKSQPLTTLNLYGSSVVPYIPPYKVQNSGKTDTPDLFCEILIRLNQSECLWFRHCLFVGQSPHHSDQMSQESQVSWNALF